MPNLSAVSFIFDLSEMLHVGMRSRTTSGVEEILQKVVFKSEAMSWYFFITVCVNFFWDCTGVDFFEPLSNLSNLDFTETLPNIWVTLP